MATVLALDFETANQSASSACQLGIVRLQDWRVVDSQVWMIRPPTDEFVFTYLHGLSWEDVEREPDWGGLWPKIERHFVGVDYLAAHNAPFDRSVLNAACAEYGITPPLIPFIDTVAVARKVWKIFPTKLNNVCSKLSIPLQHHEALSDARACAEILAKAAQEGWLPE